jgi:uncharacterized membrane protein YdjX (TVP38/TMEM64 family)
MSDEKSFPWKWAAIGATVLALFASWFLLPVDEWISAFNQWIQELGPIGYLIFAIIYIVATVALFPGAILTLAAGLAFGLWGFPLVVVAATIGASLAFLVGRYLARDAVEKRWGDSHRFKAIDSAVGEEGWKIVGLLRLSPLIPFNLQNYIYGLTDIKFWHYVAATFFGIMPGSLMYVYFGAAGKAALAGGDGGDPVLRWSLFGAGLVATIIVTVLVTRKARAKLDEMGLEDETEEAGPAG